MTPPEQTLSLCCGNAPRSSGKARKENNRGRSLKARPLSTARGSPSSCPIHREPGLGCSCGYGWTYVYIFLSFQGHQIIKKKCCLGRSLKILYTHMLLITAFWGFPMGPQNHFPRAVIEHSQDFSNLCSLNLLPFIFWNMNKNYNPRKTYLAFPWTSEMCLWEKQAFPTDVFQSLIQYLSFSYKNFP